MTSNALYFCLGCTFLFNLNILLLVCVYREIAWVWLYICCGVSTFLIVWTIIECVYKTCFHYFIAFFLPLSPWGFVRHYSLWSCFEDRWCILIPCGEIGLQDHLNITIQYKNMWYVHWKVFNCIVKTYILYILAWNISSRCFFLFY